MDSGEGDKISKYSKKTQDVNLSDSGNVLQSARIRRSVCFSDEVDRIILDNRPYLLCHVGLLFWLILLFSKK